MNVHHRVNNSLSLVSILIHIYSLHNLMRHLSLGLTSGLFPSDFRPKFYMHFSSLPRLPCVRPNLSSFDLITSVTFGQEYKLCGSSFSLFSNFLFPLPFLLHHVLNHLQSAFSLQCEKHFSAPYKRRDRLKL
jgi:hypothetical protein